MIDPEFLEPLGTPRVYYVLGEEVPKNVWLFVRDMNKKEFEHFKKITECEMNIAKAKEEHAKIRGALDELKRDRESQERQLAAMRLDIAEALKALGKKPFCGVARFILERAYWYGRQQ